MERRCLTSSLTSSTSTAGMTSSPGGWTSTSPMAEPLTNREMEVLRLLDTEMSTAAIAEHLVISLHTLRTHTKRIYGKLDVHSRIQAVARAHDLGMM